MIEPVGASISRTRSSMSSFADTGSKAVKSSAERYETGASGVLLLVARDCGVVVEVEVFGVRFEGGPVARTSKYGTSTLGTGSEHLDLEEDMLTFSDLTPSGEVVGVENASEISKAGWFRG